NDGAAFERPMTLRARQWVSLTRRTKRRPNREVLVPRRAQRIDIEPGAMSHSASFRASIPQRQTQRVVSKSRLHPNRTAYSRIAELNLHPVRIFDPEFSGGLSAD